MPSSRIVPDVAEKLPGRGIWIKADRESVKKAAEKGLFARAAKAKVKADAGLADRVSADVMAEALAYARDLAANVSPRSMRVIKRQMWNALVQGLAEAMRDADDEMALSLKSDDFKEGVASFVEKRQVRFTGR